MHNTHLSLSLSRIANSSNRKEEMEKEKMKGEKKEHYYKKGLWTGEEDRILLDYVNVHGRGQWNRIPKITGLKRCGKSCRLRWMNYLCPNVKRGDFSEQEDDLIIRLHNLLGNRWSLIAGRVPGRTDNQVKNHWNTHLCKKLGVKKQIRKVVGSSSKSHNFTQLAPKEPTLVQVDSSNNFHICSSTAVAALDTDNLNGSNDASDNDQVQSTGKNCFDSIWFSNDYINLTSPGLIEFLDGHPFDLIWQGP